MFQTVGKRTLQRYVPKIASSATITASTELSSAIDRGDYYRKALRHLGGLVDRHVNEGAAYPDFRHADSLMRPPAGAAAS